MLISKRVMVVLMCGAMILGVSFAALAVEMNLAGIRLGSPVQSVLLKYGNL